MHQNLHDGRRNTDDEEEHIDEQRADLLRTVHGVRLFFKNTGKDHRNQRDPDVLAAEEHTAHPRRPAAIGWKERCKRPAGCLGDRHNHDGIGNAHGDVAQRYILAPPVRRRERPALLGHPLSLHLVDEGVPVKTANKDVACKREQDQKVDRHVEVVRDDRRGDKRSADLECIRESREVDATADVGARHHRRDPWKSLNGVLQEGAADHRPRNCPE